MKKNFIKMMLVMGIMTSGFSIESKADNIGNNILKSGIISDIEYSDIDSYYEKDLDKIYFKIDGHIYLYYDFVEDLSIGDNVLIIMNDMGTENLEDDIIRGYKAWNPESEFENGIYNLESSFIR